MELVFIVCCFIANPHRVLVELGEAISDTLELCHDVGARVRMLILDCMLEARPEVHRLVANLNLYGNHARPSFEENIYGNNQVKATVSVWFRIGNVVVLLDYRKSRYSREHIVNDEDIVFEIRDNAHAGNVLKASQLGNGSIAKLSLALLDCRIKGFDAARHDAEGVSVIAERHLLTNILNAREDIS